MIIACLGWGSLIWDPRKLELRNNRPEAWHNDGPRMPIGYAGVSSRERMTLVIVPRRRLVTVLWNEMKGDDIDRAIRSLREREETDAVECWRSGANGDSTYARRIGTWARRVGVDAVMWTALSPKFGGRLGRIPSRAEVIKYLRPVEGVDRTEAERYVRRTPSQIKTRYRAAIESALGWTYDANF